MELSVTAVALGLTWPRWKRLVDEVEALGFAGLFMGDHFRLPVPVETSSLDSTVALTYVAHQSQRVHFGPLVSPLSLRDPVILARQAMAMDDLSRGRMILGVGTGWVEREHTMFGYDLGDVKTRLDRLEEGLAVITQLVRSDEPVTFEGSHYRLQEARLLPRPQRATPILVGGHGPKRTLPLVARYADVWNCQVASAETFAERSALLDDLLKAEGRQPGDLKRTVMVPIICWLDEADLERRLDHLRRDPPMFPLMSTEETLALIRRYFAGILGTPDEVIEQLSAYAAAGVEEVIIQWFGLGDIEGLTTLADKVLAHFRS
jgi:alkanesulfonate monooxygenase SsuD/methylene tetrahydromethanopterin reductase-like flavin-dependent oxidoreductase (luciferase family)